MGSITEYSYQGNTQTRPCGADDIPRLLRITGWCPRVCMERQSDDPSQYLKQSECTIKKANGRARFEASSLNISLDRQDLTQTEWESCVAVLIGATQQETYDTPLTLRARHQESFSFLLLCHTTGRDIYGRVGIFHAWLQDRPSDSDLCESCVETPDWEESGCDHDHSPSEDLDYMENLLVAGLTMTHDLRMGLFRTQEDQAKGYDFAKDPHRFTEEPDEAFEDSLIISWDFPDWERRVLIVQ